MIPIEGFVLAGGHSRRMGRNKADLLLGGVTLIDRATAVLEVVADPVHVVGRLPVERASLKIIEDEPVGKNVRGAIVGLYTALFHAKTEWAFVLACDLPFVSGELLTRMASVVAHLTDNSNDNADAVLVEQPDGRVQPLCGLYRVEGSLPGIKKMLIEDNWRLQDLSKHVSTRILRFTEFEEIPFADNLFLNVNTPDDYRTAVKYESSLRDIRSDHKNSGGD
jgi:molybdopterin-guanine dinucleotide biosynthesis protein A